jgi:hypothetical protein
VPRIEALADLLERVPEPIPRLADLGANHPRILGARILVGAIRHARTIGAVERALAARRQVASVGHSSS